MHACQFCVAPSAWGSPPLQKPIEDVVADIRRHPARKIVFLDLNLIGDPTMRPGCSRRWCRSRSSGLD